MSKMLEAFADAPQPRWVGKRESVEAAAERLGIEVEEVEGLRQQLGCHLEEIRDVEVTADGIVVTAKAGNQVIFRSASNPDANGNTGWLHVRRPDGRDVEADEKDETDPTRPPDYATPIFAKPKPVAKSRKKAAEPAVEPETEPVTED